MSLIILGKSASGKSTITKELNKRGYKTMITYTTRPPRLNEVDGIDYHFLPTYDFLEKMKNDFFAEITFYNVGEEIWFYGSDKKDYYDDKYDVAILNVDGLRQLKKNDIPVKSAYIDVPQITITRRLEARGDNRKESVRRCKSDLIDFSYITPMFDYIIDGEQSIATCSDEIEKIILSMRNEYE